MRSAFVRYWKKNSSDEANNEFAQLAAAPIALVEHQLFCRGDKAVDAPLKRTLLAKTQRTPRMNENEIRKIVVDAAIAVHVSFREALKTMASLVPSTAS